MGGRAFDSWKNLRGVICTYKPPDTSFQYVLYKLKYNICKELNKLETRPARKCIVADRIDGEVSISVRPSYADNVLCSGPRYQDRHVQVAIVRPLSFLSSGVMPVLINVGNTFKHALKKLSFTRCYHVKGILGQVTDNFESTGKVLARARYDKVNKTKFENVLASYQSALQARVFEEYGVPLYSQEAYNFAVKGLYRPVWNGPTIIYSTKLVDFEPPNFTIEVQCISENQASLTNMIHNLGLTLKCYATCTGIRCLRHGCFHVEHALAKNQWTLDYILENLKLTWDLLEKSYPNKLKFSPVVTTVKAKEKFISSS